MAFRDFLTRLDFGNLAVHIAIGSIRSTVLIMMVVTLLPAAAALAPHLGRFSLHVC